MLISVALVSNHNPFPLNNSHYQPLSKEEKMDGEPGFFLFSGFNNHLQVLLELCLHNFNRTPLETLQSQILPLTMEGSVTVGRQAVTVPPSLELTVNCVNCIWLSFSLSLYLSIYLYIYMYIHIYVCIYIYDWKTINTTKKKTALMKIPQPPWSTLDIVYFFFFCLIIWCSADSFCACVRTRAHVHVLCFFVSKHQNRLGLLLYRLAEIPL